MVTRFHSSVVTFFAAFAFASACASSDGFAADERSWTNNQGRTIQATFVRIDGDNVVLDVAGKPAAVAIDTLSEADQQYAKQQSENTASLGTLSERRQSKQALDSPRTWTDSQGNTMEAQFIRIHQGNLVLKQGARVSSLAFDKFSQEDQDFLKEHLEKAGEDVMLANLESDRLQKLAIAERNQRSAETSSPASYSGSTSDSSSSSGRMAGVSSMPSMTSPPQIRTPSQPNMSDHFARMNEDRQRRMDEQNQRLAEMERQNRERMEEQRRSMQESQDRMIAKVENQRMQQTQIPFSSAGQTVLMCMTCNKEVPSTTAVGDRCPHCNVRFDYEDDQNGNRVATHNSGQYGGQSNQGSSRVRVSGRGIGAVMSFIGLIATGIGYSARRLFA